MKAMQSTPGLFLFLFSLLIVIFNVIKAQESHSKFSIDHRWLLSKRKGPQLAALGVRNIVTADKKPKILIWIPDGMKNAISSGVATVVVKSILQPLDTIKTVQQIQDVQKTLLATAQEILQTRGVAGLWSGTIVSALGSAPAAAVYYGVFSEVKKRLAVILPLKYRFIAVASAATVSNTIASVFRVPYEVYKQRLQARLHSTIWEAAVYSWQKEGPLGLFQNGKLASQIIRDVPYAIITAIIYDSLQVLINHYRSQRREEGVDVAKNNDKFYQLQDAICGATAGGLSSFLTTPMDVIKTRLMTGSNNYHSFLDAMMRIGREEGINGFFSGSASRVLHKIPANALFFVFYESIRYLLGAVEKRSEQ